VSSQAVLCRGASQPGHGTAGGADQGPHQGPAAHAAAHEAAPSGQFIPVWYTVQYKGTNPRSQKATTEVDKNLNCNEGSLCTKKREKKY